MYIQRYVHGACNSSLPIVQLAKFMYINTHKPMTVSHIPVHHAVFHHARTYTRIHLYTRYSVNVHLAAITANSFKYQTAPRNNKLTLSHLHTHAQFINQVPCYSNNKYQYVYRS